MRTWSISSVLALAAIILGLGLGGCLDQAETPASTISVSTRRAFANALIQTGAVAKYSSSAGPVECTVARVAEAWNLHDHVVPTLEVMCNSGQGDKGIERAFYVSRSHGEIVGASERLRSTSGPAVYRTAAARPEDVAGQVPWIGFQLWANPTLESFSISRQRVVPQTRENDFQLTLTWHEVDAISGMENSVEAEYYVTLRPGVPFPEKASGTPWGEIELQSYDAGRGPRIDVASFPSTPHQDIQGVPWESALPPESSPSSLEFGLWDAWKILASENATARAYMDAHPTGFLCDATYATFRPLIPPNYFEWRFKVCGRDGTFLAGNVQRDDSVLKRVGGVFADSHKSDEPSVPSSELARSILPIDQLAGAVMHRQDWSFGNVSLHFSASWWHEKFLRFGDPPEYENPSLEFVSGRFTARYALQNGYLMARIAKE